MFVGLSRTTLQKLAENRIEDAEVLFANDRFSAAYYLLGYSIEFGLKACIARRVVAETIPLKGTLDKVFTHDFGPLVSIAGLSGELKSRQNADANFHANWGIVSSWSPERRYESQERSEAHYLLEAITNQDHGVMSWIREHW